MTANVAKSPASPPDDMITCLAKAAAAFDRPARIVTFSRTPVEGLMGQVFGPDAAANLVVNSRTAVDPTDDFVLPDGTAASPLDFDPAVYAVVPRFVLPGPFDLTARHYRGWLAGAAAVILHFTPDKKQTESLSDAGLRDVHTFPSPGRDISIFLRAPEKLSPPRDSSEALDRPHMRRLVIVDPNLGGARGHFAPYALSLTQGATARGVEVVWGCHARLEDHVTPAGVEVRRCFSKCLFDLSKEELVTADLSPELLEGWIALLNEFDGAGTHFLVHSADAHLLRAAAALLEQRPEMRSVVHLSFHTDPRRMLGRTAGDEAHRVVLQLRRSPQWERSLFLSTENRRFSRWMSEWLQARVPTLPLLAPSGPGAGIRERRPGASVTLSFLGEARRAKGFLKLPELMDHIAAEPSLAAALKVVIQNWPPFRGEPEPHEEVVASLRRHPFVEIVDGMLDADGYDRRLAETDVLLLPYNPEIYDLRGSGILIEGLSRGAAIVVRAGTSMEESVKDGVVLAYESPEDLVEVLTRLVKSFDETSEKARGMAVRFRQLNTPERYVGALDARARGKR
jgi:hypothetical protein